MRYVILTSKLLFAASVNPVLFCALNVVPLIWANIPFNSVPVLIPDGSGILLSTVQVILFPDPVPQVVVVRIVKVAKITNMNRVQFTVRVPLLVL